MRKHLFTLALLFTTFCISGQTNDAFKQDAQKLITIVSEPMFDTMIKPLKSMIPQEKFPAAEKEIKDSMPKLYESMAKVYMEEFTHNEIKELLQFYETPIGKKMASKSAVLAQKAMVAAGQWSQETLAPILTKYNSNNN
ncbi:MAG: DUF2059 domain-containing protein [Capnocytophaga sp.]|nr:DUF2059 domain-containing protein [Capnocytophaga sp.]